jgi:hypothetical protein
LSTSEFDDLFSGTVIAKPTAADYARIVKLEAGVKALAEELKQRKDHVKAYFEQENGIVKGEESHAGASFIFDVTHTKDLAATAKKFPINKHPDKWVTPAPVLDLDAIAPKDIVTSPSLRLTVKKEN